MEILQISATEVEISAYYDEFQIIQIYWNDEYYGWGRRGICDHWIFEFYDFRPGDRVGIMLNFEFYKQIILHD